MAIKTQLENDVKDAMRARDEQRKGTLRMALAAIKFAEIEGRVALDDAAVLAILQKEIKARRETIADAERAGRAAAIAEAEAEIVILSTYLPKQLSTEELEKLAREAISEVGATSAKEMGQVMKVLIPRLQGQATGNEASQVVRKLLQ